MGRFTKPLHEISINDMNEAGHKAVNLGNLGRAGANVPEGCCVLRTAYSHFKEYSRLQSKIDALLSEMNCQDMGSIERNASAIRDLITSSKLPPDLRDALSGAIGNLSEHGQCFLAVRPSFVSENHQTSLAGGLASPFYFLKGTKGVIEHTKTCWSSYWSSKATLNRCNRKIDQNQEYVAPIIQRMVDSRVSGVMYTCYLDPGFKNEIRIEASWGLGDTVVSGRSMHDLYVMRKQGLSLKEKRIVKKTVMAVFDERRGSGSTEKAVDSEMMDTDCLRDSELRELSEAGLEIEKLFGSPQEIDWSYQGKELFILGSRNFQWRKEI